MRPVCSPNPVSARIAAAVVVLTAAAVVVLTPLVVAPRAAAQDNFRITYDQRSDTTHTIVAGRIANEARADALDVYVTAEALDGSKRVVASGVAFVAPSIPSRGSVPFSVKVPKVPAANSYRVKVTSFRYGLAGESP